MGARRSQRAAAARAVAIGLVALFSVAPAAAASSRSREDGAVWGVGHDSSSGRAARETQQLQQRGALLEQEGLFAQQAFLEQVDRELSRKQNILWERDAGAGAVEEARRQGEDPPDAVSFEFVRVAASAAEEAARAGSDPHSDPYFDRVSTGQGEAKTAESVDLQGEAEEEAGGGLAGVAAGVLAALAAAAGAALASAAPATLAELSKANLFASDGIYYGEDGESEFLPANPGSSQPATAGGLRGGGGDGNEAGRGAEAGGHVHRALQVTPGFYFVQFFPGEPVQD